LNLVSCFLPPDTNICAKNTVVVNKGFNRGIWLLSVFVLMALPPYNGMGGGENKGINLWTCVVLFLVV